MYNDITKAAPPLPSPELTILQPGVALLRPLSRRGIGPGIIVLTTDHRDPEFLAIENGVPSVAIKWAEEGYTVVQIQIQALADSTSRHALQLAVEALTDCEKCEPKDKIGLVAYESKAWNLVAPVIPSYPRIVAAAIYADAPVNASSRSIDSVSIPVVHHFAGQGSATTIKTKKEFFYPNVASYKFATPFHDCFHYNAENISHTRNLTLLKGVMNGPYFDLEAIWDEHCYYEFADRSMEHTMSTMVQEPYVNHVPTHNFIFNNSADSELELTSRTTGIDRIVDEFIFKFTHDQMIDWILPGVPPTHKKVEVPFTAVVNIRGDRLYHEHIAWDQGTVLRQIGLMPEWLPFPYLLPDGKTASEGKSLEYRVPVAGIEVAQKMRDRTSGLSNEMFEYRTREV